MAVLAVAAMVIAVLQEIGVGAQIVAEPLLESGHQVEMEFARAIDLATREIAAVEIELGIATWEAVPRIGAPSETVTDTVVAVCVPAAAEVLPAWAVRVGALAERAVQVAVVVVAGVAVAGDRIFN